MAFPGRLNKPKANKTKSEADSVEFYFPAVSPLISSKAFEW